MRLDAVVRSSREGYREAIDMRSYVEQEADIRAWASRAGHEIAAVHVERDTSGKTTNRKALKEVRRRIEAGETDGLVVAYTSRFSRNAVEGLELALWILSAPRREFVTLELLGADFRSPMGEYILTNALALARQEWATKRAGFQRARTGAIERGVHLQERFGYTKGADRRLIPLEHEARWVEPLYQKRAGGMSWPQLAQWLNDNGVRPHQFPTRRDGKPTKRKAAERWTHTGVKALIESPVYLGVAFSGKDEHGNAIETPDAHPALVSRELWDRANGRRDLRPRRGHEEYRLSGLIYSEVSGAKLTGNSTRKKVNGGEKTYRYYAERTQTDGPKISGRVVADSVEQIVADEWRKRAGNHRYYAVRVEGDMSALIERRDQLIAAKRDHARNVDMHMTDRESWTMLRDEYDRLIEEVGDAIARERASVTGIMASEMEIADPLSAPVDRVRELFGEVFSAVYLTADKTAVRVFGRDETPNRDGIGGRLLAIA